MKNETQIAKNVDLELLVEDLEMRLCSGLRKKMLKRREEYWGLEPKKFKGMFVM